MAAAVATSPVTESQKDEVVASIRSFYDDGSSYGSLSQSLHAVQAAQQAVMAGAPKEVVVGALLHDIGWKLARENPKTANGSSIYFNAPEQGCVAAKLGILSHCEIPDGADSARLRAQHDVIGGTYLRMLGFDETVAHIVEGHVLAKRYLCFKESDYHGKLSNASKRTLEFQGGPMTADEAAIFEKDPLFTACVEMRRWDEGAKQPHWSVPNFASYEKLVRECVVRAKTEAGERKGTYEREGNTIVGLVNTQDTTTVQNPAWAPTIPAQSCLRSPRATDLLAQWEEKGYVVLRRDEWIDEAQIEAVSKATWEVPDLKFDGAWNGPFHTWEKDAKGETVPSRTEAFADHHPVLEAFLKSDETSPLKRVVSHLAGERVALYKDKINYKAPGGGGYTAHQDGYRGLDVPQYQSPSDRGFIAYVCMVAVDDMTVENGCPELGWECWQRKEGWLIEKRDEHSATFKDMGPYEALELRKGDVLIYDNYMPHKSGTNKSDHWRRALFGIYYGNVSEPRDLRTLYYEREAVGRRANGSSKGGGKANAFHTGTPVILAQ